MKAFWASVLAAIAISVVAFLVMRELPSSSADVYQSQHGATRLE